MSNDNSAKSTPLSNTKSTPLALSAQLCCRNRYLSSDQITKISIEIFKSKGRGIVYADLLEKGLANHTQKSQGTLKYHLRKGTLFTLGDKRPQQYYPSAIRSDIMENLQKNTLLDPIGIASHNKPHFKGSSPLDICLKTIIIQSLEGYVLPLLPEAPLFIHNMHFKTKVTPECYSELKLPYYKGNYGKHHTEVIRNTHVDYIFYSSGTVNINTTCSKNPHKLESEEDRSIIMAFFGQIRDRLILLLYDKHERLVPDIMEWQLTEADINKDIKVGDYFHYTGIKIQVKHLDHLFNIYIKSMGKDTVCRLEERKHPKNKSAIDFINDIFNPEERLEKRLEAMEQRINQKIDSISR